MAQWKQIRLGIMRLQVQSLASISGLRIRRCHELWCGSQTRLRSGVAWLWCRPAATAPIRPVAWEPPHAAGVALEKAERPKKKKKKKRLLLKPGSSSVCSGPCPWLLAAQGPSQQHPPLWSLSPLAPRSRAGPEPGLPQTQIQPLEGWLAHSQAQ